MMARWRYFLTLANPSGKTQNAPLGSVLVGAFFVLCVGDSVGGRWEKTKKQGAEFLPNPLFSFWRGRGDLNPWPPA
jgi:hypothetical protein